MIKLQQFYQNLGYGIFNFLLCLVDSMRCFLSAFVFWSVVVFGFSILYLRQLFIAGMMPEQIVTLGALTRLCSSVSRLDSMSLKLSTITTTALNLLGAIYSERT